MCSYNAEEYVGLAIESIINQTYTNWELLIVDDASTNNTREVIKAYLGDPRIQLIEQPRNVGYLRNKNYGFTLTTGDLVTQLDSDDTCPADRLQKQVAVFTQHPEIQICGSNYCQIDQYGTPLPHKEYPADFIVKEPGGEYPFWFPGLMFRSSVVKEFGLFSEYFIDFYGDDHYWTIRVNQKYPIYFIKDVLYHYRVNPNSMTNSLKNPRQMIVTEVIDFLNKQQQETGTDCLERGRPEELLQFEHDLLHSKTIMSEKYRIWAARALDMNKFDSARQLLNKAFRLNKWNMNYYRTLKYFYTKKYFSK